MENFYNKTKSLAIAALILVLIVFIWDAATIIRSLISMLEYLDYIYHSIRNSISSLLRLAFSYGCVVALNIMILTKQKNKTFMLVALVLGLVILGLQVTGGFSLLVDSIFLLIKNQIFFSQVLVTLIKLILKVILFIITLYQFMPFMKLVKQETAA